WLKNSGIDSRRNYSHSTARLGYCASIRELGQPIAVCHHACSGITIRTQFPRICSICQQSVCRPPQDRTRVARADLARVFIASTVKKAAPGDVPHVVNTDDDTHSPWQHLQPTRYVEP